MNSSFLAGRDRVDDLVNHISRSLNVSRTDVMPFSDFVDVMVTILTHLAASRTLVVGGHATPEIQLAAHRSGLDLIEAVGASPFAGHAEDTLERLTSDKDTIYLGNPNWVTGSNYALKDMSRLAEALPNGLLVIDEKYFDFYGISALPLLQQHGNIAILRSLTSGFGIDHDSSGFVVTSPERAEQLRSHYDWAGLSRTLMTILSTTLVSADALSQRLALIHNEAFRVASRLTELGVQNRMTSADFLLVRVADPKRVGNFLARSSAAPENLEGYPGLEYYLKYRLQSPLTNDNFLTAFAKMPREYFHLDNMDRRAVMFHRSADRTQTPGATAPRSRVRLAELHNEVAETVK